MSNQEKATSAFALEPGAHVDADTISTATEHAIDLPDDNLTVVAIDEDPSENYVALVLAQDTTYAGLAIVPSGTQLSVHDTGASPDTVTATDIETVNSTPDVETFTQPSYPPEDGVLVAPPTGDDILRVIDHDISPSRYFFYALADPTTGNFARLLSFHDSDLPLRTQGE
ncbi:hypothetical protein [Salinibaculum rarum]|uniref:hypothetical protein n=1 Tax=Salinibaculum rarum TaxID=3058903 RepID=UPI00265FFEB4|nr:hypothetical protein [Salinibaculum sp. KK48]